MLQGDHLRQLCDGTFRGCIGGSSLHSYTAHDGSDVYNRAAAAAKHSPYRFPSMKEIPARIGRNNAVPVRNTRLQERLVQCLDGIIHQHIKPARALQRVRRSASEPSTKCNGGRSAFMGGKYRLGTRSGSPAMFARWSIFFVAVWSYFSIRLSLRRIEIRRQEVRAEGTRFDQRDSNPERRHLLRQGFRQILQSEFRCGIQARAAISGQTRDR